MKPLPTKLLKEPIVDAIFEVRFDSGMPASVFLPGILLPRLGASTTMERLPHADLPKAIRDADINMKFAPLVRLSWGNMFVLISDSSLAVACKLPYPGWTVFKKAIEQVFESINDFSPMITNVHRYAMKYVDLIPSSSIEEQVHLINADLRVGTHQLKREQFQLRIEIPRDDFLHAVAMVSGGELILHDGQRKVGMIIDVETMKALSDSTLTSVFEGLSEKLDSIHTANKEIFFECLTENTITSLGATYE